MFEEADTPMSAKWPEVAHCRHHHQQQHHRRRHHYQGHRHRHSHCRLHHHRLIAIIIVSS